MIRPVTAGRLKSVGQVVSTGKSQIIAESIVRDFKDREVGRGSGIFVRSKLPLTDAKGYESP